MTPPIGSGARDRWITIQSRPTADAKSSSHYPVETWSTLVELWAAKEDLRGSERFAHVADQKIAAYDSRWEIPYLESMDPELVNVPKLRRLVVQGRVHDIVAAEEVDRKRGIKLTTLAGGLLA